MWIILALFSYLVCISHGRRVKGKQIQARLKLLQSNRGERKALTMLLRASSTPSVGWHVTLSRCTLWRLVGRTRTDALRISCSTSTPQLFLLDRDGVINRDVGAPGVVNIEDLELLPGSASAIRRLKECGKQVVLVTNQSCRGKGLISAEELESIHTKLRDLLAEEGATFDELYVCEDAGPGPRKKPEPGMLLEAMMRFDSLPNTTVMIGDSWSDVVAARRADCSGVLVTTGHGERLGAALGNRGLELPTTLQAYNSKDYYEWLDSDNDEPGPGGEFNVPEDFDDDEVPLPFDDEEVPLPPPACEPSSSSDWSSSSSSCSEDAAGGGGSPPPTRPCGPKDFMRNQASGRKCFDMEPASSQQSPSNEQAQSQPASPTRSSQQMQRFLPPSLSESLGRFFSNYEEFGVQNDAEALLAAEALGLPLRVYSDLAQAVDEILR